MNITCLLPTVGAISGTNSVVKTVLAVGFLDLNISSTFHLLRKYVYKHNLMQNCFKTSGSPFNLIIKIIFL